MKIKNLDAIYLAEFSILMELGYIDIENNNDDTYNLNIKCSNFINTLTSSSNSNEFMIINFVDIRSYTCAEFAPITINLPKDAYKTIELD